MQTIVCLSGGLDSTTALAMELQLVHHTDIFGVTFDYGSKHNRWEIPAARRICKYYSIHHRVLNVRMLFASFRSTLLLSGGRIPEGRYNSDSMKQTVVPGRNMIFASILAGLAASLDASEVLIGIHQGDHTIYPDCRPMFFLSMNHTIRLATEDRVELKAPLLWKTKDQVVGIGKRLGVPFDLTRTCYKNQKRACGRCGACNERLNAFQSNMIVDPIEYA